MIPIIAILIDVHVLNEKLIIYSVVYNRIFLNAKLQRLGTTYEWIKVIKNKRNTRNLNVKYIS